MKIGPDGSLPRITSSTKCITSNLKIAKVTDEDGISKTGFLYKLVFTGENEESELSEKSDDEAWSEEDIPDINPSEKDKSRESADLSNRNQSMVESRPQNVEFERPHNKNSNRSNRWNPYSYNNKKNLPSSFNNPSNEDRKNFNSNKRSRGSSGNYGKKYNTVQDTPNPWVVPPIVGPHNQLAFACHANYMLTHMEPLIQAPPLNSAFENLVPQIPKSVGLLGDSPYSPSHNFPRQLDFPPNKQGEEFGSHPKKCLASNIKDSFHPHPPNYHLDYQASEQNEGFLSHPPNYEPNSNNDEFGSPLVNYQASTSNEKQYNSYPENYSNHQRLSHYPKPFHGHRKICNNPRTYWRHRKNRQYVNNYNGYQSGRAQRNDRRNANDRLDYRN